MIWNSDPRNFTESAASTKHKRQQSSFSVFHALTFFIFHVSEIEESALWLGKSFKPIWIISLLGFFFETETSSSQCTMKTTNSVRKQTFWWLFLNADLIHCTATLSMPALYWHDGQENLPKSVTERWSEEWVSSTGEKGRDLRFSSKCVQILWSLFSILYILGFFEMFLVRGRFLPIVERLAFPGIDTSNVSDGRWSVWQ